MNVRRNYRPGGEKYFALTISYQMFDSEVYPKYKYIARYNN